MKRHYSRPAEALLAVVEDDVLTGRGAAQRLVEMHFDAVGGSGDTAGDIRLPVPDLRGARKFRRRCRSTDPMRRRCRKPGAVERGMVRALHDDERIARDVLARHEPGRVVAAREAADPEAAALAERVALESAVAPDHAAIRGFDRAGPSRQPTAHEIAEGALTDKADAGRVALLRDRQPALPRDGPHLALAEVPDWKHAVRELFRCQRVQEVSLVLVAVHSAQDLPADSDAGVVACCVSLGAKPARIVEADAELDLAVAAVSYTHLTLPTILRV